MKTVLVLIYLTSAPSTLVVEFDSRDNCELTLSGLKADYKEANESMSGLGPDWENFVLGGCYDK